ncbi:MAG TPA: hypothetical protein VMW24_10945 [Sedimentisphaerales bacterium]|nr:hypothetical protein [Sedimentisphaerales bacterium]
MPRNPKSNANKTPVRSRRLDTNTEDVDITQHAPRIMIAEGPAVETLHKEPIVVSQRQRNMTPDKIAALKFNEEILSVRVAESGNPTDDPLPFVIVNGVKQYFERGTEMQVKRKYIERLARAKKTTFSQVKLPNNEGYRNIPHTTLEVQFSVLEDPSGQVGRDWLKGILAEEA